MIDNKLKQWLTYWKNSLIDGQRGYVDYRRKTHFILDNTELAHGYLPAQEVNQLIDTAERNFNNSRGITQPLHPKWIKLDTVALIISPITFSTIPKHTHYTSRTKQHYPFWIKAVADRSGKLMLPENPLPHIPRTYLAPSFDDVHELIIGHVTDVDKAIAEIQKQEDGENWSNYYSYCVNIFESITGKPFEDYTHEGYQIDKKVIFMLDDQRGNAGTHIVRLYENLLSETKESPLLNCFAGITTPQPPFKTALKVKDYLTANAQHVGQMGDAYPLSISQRKSFYTYLNAPDEKVFTVNGPPGTGKTTLLQTVVANMVVKSVVEESEPPKIIACSTNNQAVTNIMDSFSNAQSKCKDIGYRWLPQLTTLACYLPATSKAEKTKYFHARVKTGEGDFAKKESDDYIQKAAPYFLEKVTHYFKQDGLDLEKSKTLLQQEVKDIQQKIAKGSALFQVCQEVTNELKEYLTQEDQEQFFPKKGGFQLTTFQEARVRLIEIDRQLRMYFDKEPLLRKLGCFLRLRFAEYKRHHAIRTIIQHTSFHIKLAKSVRKLALLIQFDELIALLDRVHKAYTLWENWKEGNEITGEPPMSEEVIRKKEYLKNQGEKANTGYCYDELDISLRHKAFWLSIHYWEASWLLTTKELLSNKQKQEKWFESDCKARWNRRAMLMPCFVSTFYMAPAFFTYSKLIGKDEFNKGVYEYPPLLNFIDLLIVDEAGQTSPEVGIATFSLAKKALVVGDTQQIEPVWSSTPNVDLGNLRLSELPIEQKALKEYDEKGKLASSGSIMKMAQEASSYQEIIKESLQPKGLMLQEHRRCFNELVAYCNEIAYKGILDPKRGKSPRTLLAPMLHYHVDGHSATENNGRYNTSEVEMIKQWLIRYYKEVVEYYGKDKKYGKKIENMVGIITPFSAQKAKLRKMIRDLKLDADIMKVGTVHALQGAERPIILFSTVYGPGDVSTMFFDVNNKPNMLNVAVSRAQDSFIVFGNRHILDGSKNTPSGKLLKYLECVG